MEFWSITGILPYAAVRELQLKLVEARIEDRVPDTVLFLEHEPVITRGRGLQFTGVERPRHIPLTQPLTPGVDFQESERGGDLTYHGPGQLVIYPICKLDGSGFSPARDVGAFLRALENYLIEELQARGISAVIKKDATGVWIDSGRKKIASLGIAIRRWVTYHGMAVNCVVDLKPFQFISPCGYSPEVMTRLADWTSLDRNWRSDLERALAQRMNANERNSLQIRSLTLSEADKEPV